MCASLNTNVCNNLNDSELLCLPSIWAGMMTHYTRKIFRSLPY